MFIFLTNISPKFMVGANTAGSQAVLNVIGGKLQSPGV